MEIVLKDVFNRLISFADGRTIVVPLSGGYDSRLIVMMLKNIGYENVITFSYGRSGNTESIVSEDVARSLGVEWEFIEYDNQLWNDRFHSKEHQKMSRISGGLGTQPNITDWPAVWELKAEERIPDNAVFAPGHAADFVAGSHIPEDLLSNPSTETLVEAILSHHYNLWEWENNDLEEVFRQRILELIDENNLDQTESVVDAYEQWDWQERQAKLIQSAGIYKYWGYNWWFPYWDRKFMEFWESVPVKYRRNKRLYDQLVEDLYTELSGEETKTTSEVKNGYREVLVSNILSSMSTILDKAEILKPFAKNLYQNFTARREYHNHPLAYYGAVADDQFYELYPLAKGFSSYNTLHRLNETDISNNSDIHTKEELVNEFEINQR